MYYASKTHYLIRFFLDSLILVLVFIISRVFIAENQSYAFQSRDYLLLALFHLSWYLSTKMSHLYNEIRSKTFAYETITVVKSVLVHAVFCTFIIFYFFKYYPVQRSFIVIYTIFLFLAIIVEKFGLRKYFQYLRKKGLNDRKVLIVGAGVTGMHFYQSILENQQYGYKVVGFLDDEKKEHLNGEYLGTVAELGTVLNKYEIEDVVVALPNSASNSIKQVINTSENNAKRVRIIPDYHKYVSNNMHVSNFASIPLITVRSLPLDELENKIFKRTFDLLFSSLLFLFVFSWLFPIIALAIKLGSKGPVFFKQERWGVNNKKIICYKFRSMVQNSKDVDETGKYQQATQNDPRVTSIGKFLRKTNLDELPQFWNVWRGDMSIVGPRPHPIPLNLESKDTVQNYMLRHLVKPGITGWAQVNGSRGETCLPGSMQKRVDLDIWYIENWSFWLDCQIILQTIINMIKGDRNAY